MTTVRLRTACGCERTMEMNGTPRTIVVRVSEHPIVRIAATFFDGPITGTRTFELELRAREGGPLYVERWPPKEEL